MTNSVLKMLYDKRGEWVSGETVAAALGCSRMTVANRIRKLKEEGFDIESNTRTGHRLARMTDVLNATSLSLFTEEPIYFYECLDSTFRKGREINGGGLIVAAAQSSAYGRRKRAFACTEGGVYFGWKFTPTLPPQRANLITLAAGVAVCRAVARYGIAARVKYPNDCLIDGKKFCGILTECMMTADAIDYANIGIGIDVHNRLDADLEDVATTLDEHGGASILRAQLIGEIVREIAALLDDADGIVAAAEKCSYFRSGDKLLLLSDEGREEGAYVGLDGDGYLLANTRDGVRRVTIGEISLRREEAL